MDTKTFVRVLGLLREEAKHWKVPVVTLVANTGNDPYRVLISCLLSLRTNDLTTSVAVKKLFDVGDTPEVISKIPVRRLEKLIYPVGFYRVKAGIIRDISKRILEEYGGKVPDSIDELVGFKGVGRKTANLVMSEGFRKPAICVDIHVHRISNRMGYVQTKTPEQTELALRKMVPVSEWNHINTTFVAFGQYHCRPLSPHCSSCVVRESCARVGVERSR